MLPTNSRPSAAQGDSAFRIGFFCRVLQWAAPRAIIFRSFELIREPTGKEPYAAAADLACEKTIDATLRGASDPSVDEHLFEGARGLRDGWRSVYRNSWFPQHKKNLEKAGLQLLHADPEVQDSELVDIFKDVFAVVDRMWKPVHESFNKELKAGPLYPAFRLGDLVSSALYVPELHIEDFRFDINEQAGEFARVIRKLADPDGTIFEPAPDAQECVAHWKGIPPQQFRPPGDDWLLNAKFFWDRLALGQFPGDGVNWSDLSDAERRTVVKRVLAGVRSDFGVERLVGVVDQIETLVRHEPANPTYGAFAAHRSTNATINVHEVID